MTVSAELARGGSRIEWVLCIEGIGWPVNEAQLSQGFAGDVFMTNDFEGTLAALLGCSVHAGLFLPRGLSERFDPQKVQWQHGGMRFSVQDQDDVLLTNVRPLDGTGRVAATAAGGDLAYTSTSLALDETDATFAEGDVIWVGSSEAILLGTRDASGAPTIGYDDCVRGYLGTPRGRFDPRPTGLDAMGWAESTDVRDYNRHWYDRRVHIYMHVPGEAASGCVRIYTGRLRSITQTKQGIVWDVATVHDMVLGTGRIRESAVQNKIGTNEFFDESDHEGYGHSHVITYGAQDGTINSYQLEHADRRISIIQWLGDALEYYGLGFFYHYRRARGGTGGVKTAIIADQTAPQALQDASGRYKIEAMIAFNKEFYWARHKAPDDSGVAEDWRTIIAQGANPELGMWNPSILGGGVDSTVRYMIDNYLDNAELSRWAVNNNVHRKVIDVALMLLTSCNNEFYRDDVVAASSSTTVIAFAGTPFADLPADYWVGYAVHAVEDSNIGEARVITASDDSSVTVGTAFSNAPTNAKEYQIRNTIYDVLPLGWGLGVMNWQIDIDAWENVRDLYLGDARVGRFAMGDEDKLDVLAVLQENVFQPYGILPYIDRTTGKLGATYVGEALPDGLVETYVAIPQRDILEVGDIETLPYAPAGSLEFQVRAAGTIVIPGHGQVRDSLGGSVQAEAEAGRTERYLEPSIGGATQTVVLKPTELDSVFRNQKLETLTMKALLNSIDDAATLSTRLTRHLERQSNPAPEVDLRLNISYLPQLHVGQVVALTHTVPINPYTAARGWSALPARILGINISFDEKPGLAIRVQLLSAGNQAKVAPAALVLSKGSDGGGDFVTCEDYQYAIDTSGAKDWAGFGSGDRIELRSLTGAVKEGPEVVLGTPASSKVYIVGTWASAIVAGDYITYAAWSASNTTAMNSCSALADANETLGAANAAAKEYA